ncbi:unnamed protein product, partial [Prunus brigantina]
MITPVTFLMSMRNYDLLIKVLLEGPLWNLAIYIFVCKDNVQHLHLNGTLIVSENGEALNIQRTATIPQGNFADHDWKFSCFKNVSDITLVNTNFRQNKSRAFTPLFPKVK